LPYFPIPLKIPLMPLQGPQKLAILLCKFSDTATEPNPVSFYKDLFVNRGTGGLNDYWVAASLGAINLDGSRVFGWKSLGINQAAYLSAHPGRGDKVRAAMDAFQLKKTDYVAFVAIFNLDLKDGGTEPPNFVLAQAGDANVTFLAHETGHVFGLEHSFDHSTRKYDPSYQEGEYYDRQDVMSTWNVDRDTGHRFSPRGPLLNVANLDRMGWLPAARVWHPMKNSSQSYEVDIVALEHPEVAGYLAAQAGGWMAEFRIPDGFDGGLTRPTVLFHDESANPNSYIIASDFVNNIHEWQPGQVYGNSLIFDRFGGTRTTVVSFDLQKKTARLRVQVKATRLPFVAPDYRGPVLAGGGKLVLLVNGRIVVIPMPNPVINVLEDGTVLHTQMERMQQTEGLAVSAFETGGIAERLSDASLQQASAGHVMRGTSNPRVSEPQASSSRPANREQRVKRKATRPANRHRPNKRPRISRTV
jgi:hypothetical protein